MFHGKLKHIEMKYHFVRDMVQNGMVKIQYIAIEKKILDAMTKPLSMTKFISFRDNPSVAKNVSLTERDC